MVLFKMKLLSMGNFPQQIGKSAVSYRNLPFVRDVKVLTFATESEKNLVLETKSITP